MVALNAAGGRPLPAREPLRHRRSGARWVERAHRRRPGPDCSRSTERSPSRSAGSVARGSSRAPSRCPLETFQQRVELLARDCDRDRPRRHVVRRRGRARDGERDSRRRRRGRVRTVRRGLGGRDARGSPDLALELGGEPLSFVPFDEAAAPTGDPPVVRARLRAVTRSAPRGRRARGHRRRAHRGGALRGRRRRPGVAQRAPTPRRSGLAALPPARRTTVVVEPARGPPGRATR